MALQTLYSTAQTREAVIRAFQGNTTTIGWILVGHTAGYIFKPGGSPNQFGLVQNVPSVLSAIGGNSFLVIGNAGLAISQGITQSTTNGRTQTTTRLAKSGTARHSSEAPSSRAS